MPPCAKQRLLHDVLGTCPIAGDEPGHVAQQRRAEIRVQGTDKLVIGVLSSCHIAEYVRSARKVHRCADRLNRRGSVSVSTVMRINARSTRMLVVAASLGLTLSACGASGAPAPASPAGGYTKGTGQGTSAKLSISGYMFSSLTVKAGSTVAVSNDDAVDHTVTIGDAGIDVRVPAGGSATFVAPTAAGNYKLTCDFHPTMTGTLKVTA